MLYDCFDPYISKKFGQIDCEPEVLVVHRSKAAAAAGGNTRTMGGEPH
jgi:hypothetical protein